MTLEELKKHLNDAEFLNFDKGETVHFDFIQKGDGSDFGKLNCFIRDENRIFIIFQCDCNHGMTCFKDSK